MIGGAWPVEELCAVEAPEARAAIAGLLRGVTASLDRIQMEDLRVESPGPDSALQDAYIEVEDLASALLVAWTGSDEGCDGRSGVERLGRELASAT